MNTGLKEKLDAQLSETLRVRDRLRWKLSGQTVNADTMAEALAEYYPDLSQDARREIVEDLLCGVRSGQSFSEQVLDRISNGEDPMYSTLEELLRDHTPDEQHRILQLTYHNLLDLAEIPVDEHTSAAISGMTAETLKSDIAFIAREQGLIFAQDVLGAAQLAHVNSVSVEEQSFTPEESDLIEAAAHCVAHKLQTQEARRQAGHRTGAFRGFFSRAKSWFVRDCLPTAMGIAAGLAAFCGFAALLVAAGAPLVAAVAAFPILELGLDIVGSVVMFGSGIGAYNLGTKLQERFIEQEDRLEEEARIARDALRLHSEYLNQRAAELASAESYENMQQESEFEETPMYTPDVALA